MTRHTTARQQFDEVSKEMSANVLLVLPQHLIPPLILAQTYKTGYVCVLLQLSLSLGISCQALMFSKQREVT